MAQQARHPPRTSSVVATALPPGALLAAYAETQAYTDCYSVTVGRPVSFAEFIEAFYTTPPFKLERWLLGRFAGLASTDAEARRLAQGQASRFAAWHVEAREPHQAILAAGRTRSWLMVGPQPAEPGATTTLFFGSAVVPRKRGGMGWSFNALLGFHKLYSRVLLGTAARRLARGSCQAQGLG
jgi:hypothetical protein